MKLSQVLKDWPENKNYDLSWVGAGAIDIAEMRGEMAGHNHALTSCDREIDREALAEALFMFVKNHDNEKTSVSDDIKDFISTMPTWLRKVK
jgi:hypothetical protein